MASNHLNMGALIIVVGSCLLKMGCCSSSSSSSEASILQAMIVFGDSTVDSGNNNYMNTVVKSDFHPYGRVFDSKKPTGRFSDGRIVTDFIAERARIPYPLPYLHPDANGDRIMTGINFASSASGIHDSTAAHFNVAPLSRQLEWFRHYKVSLQAMVGLNKSMDIISKALFIVSTGSNDYVNNYYLNPRLRSNCNVSNYTDFLSSLKAQFLKDLYKEGARKVAVISLPPLGCLPSQITFHGWRRPGCVESLNKVSMDANLKLQHVLNLLKRTLPDFNLGYLDIYTLLLDASLYPKKYGFMESSRGCCGSGILEVAIGCNPLTLGTCKNGSTHVFWDTFHTTHGMNKIIANFLFEKALHQFLHY